MKNIVKSLTKEELEIVIRECNFSKNEKSLLYYRNEEKSLEECAELMNYSVRTVCNINRELNRKIIKVVSNNNKVAVS